MTARGDTSLPPGRVKCNGGPAWQRTASLSNGKQTPFKGLGHQHGTPAFGIHASVGHSGSPLPGWKIHHSPLRDRWTNVFIRLHDPSKERWILIEGLSKKRWRHRKAVWEVHPDLISRFADRQAFLHRREVLPPTSPVSARGVLISGVNFRGRLRIGSARVPEPVPVWTWSRVDS